MTPETLRKANQIVNKVENINNLLQGLQENNVITLGVGLFPPIRLRQDVVENNNEILELESRLYCHIKHLLEEYRKELSNLFDTM